jgi:hypothetical protein
LSDVKPAEANAALEWALMTLRQPGSIARAAVTLTMFLVRLRNAVPLG